MGNVRALLLLMILPVMVSSSRFLLHEARPLQSSTTKENMVTAVRKGGGGGRGGSGRGRGRGSIPLITEGAVVPKHNFKHNSAHSGYSFSIAALLIVSAFWLDSLACPTGISLRSKLQDLITTSMVSTGETNRRRSAVSYKSAAIGAASAAAAAAAIFAVRPKDPTFQLVSINLSSFHLNLPVLDLELTLAVHVTNPNIVPVRYSPASVSIFYAGSLLGSAALEAGSQPPLSCSLVYLPARLNGLQLAHHAAGILADASRRRMSLDAAVDIAGDARLLFWSHRFMLRLESHVLVDPIFLDVIDQDNHSETHLSLSIMQQ